MNVKVKLTKLDYFKELASQKAIASSARRQERLKLQKAKEVGTKLLKTRDLTELRQLITSLGDDFDWEERTHRWLMDSKPYDFVCVNMRMAGLDLNKERYCFWGIMSFSKAPVEKFSHLGDLERVIFEKDENNEFNALSTILHGVPDFLWEKIGKYENINDVLSDPKIHFKFDPGDHSIYVDRPKLRVKVKGFYIPDNYFIIRRYLDTRENILINIPCITHEHLENILKLNIYEYTKLIIELDNLIWMKWKSISLKEHITQFFKDLWNKIRFKKMERTHNDYLFDLYHVLWRVPINKQAKYLKILRKIFKEGYEKRKILINLETVIQKIIYAVEDLSQQSQFLNWQSFSSSKEYAKRFDLTNINGLSKVASESVPVAIEKIFEKALDDIAYPEKGTARTKIKQLVFWGGGHQYRIMLLILRKLRKFVVRTRKFFKKIYYKIRKREYKEEISEDQKAKEQVSLVLKNSN
ncbi:MAG: hypothetical protein HWN67_08940 [Candidatus Helarchaeota archaeon]|nr:hypothetical protein [Candidatus Helarchaeota archaeon]